MPNAEKREYENPIAEQSDDSEDEESSQDEEGSSEDRTAIEDNAISTSVLQFPVPMPNTELNQIYIRGCYDRIYDEYIRKCKNTLIIGNPGIGKSYFTLYVAYRLLADYPTASILYGSGFDGYYIYKCGRDVRRMTPPTDPLPYVDYYVFDCGQSKSAVLLDVLTAGSSKKSIVCSSPDKRKYKDYYKGCIVAGTRGPVSVRICMPTWTWDEVAFCSQHLYNIIPMPIVKKRFNVWGGIARQIFRFYIQDDDEEMLLGKIRATDIQGVLSVVNADIPVTSISSDILHAHPKEGNYASVVTKFASQFAAQRVYEKLERTSHASVISTMSAAANHPCLRGVYGLMFESYCHSQLPSERFQMKSLASAGGSETLELHRECRFFGKLQEIISLSETKRNEYYFIPKVSNFPAVDAIAPPGMVFQMTVSHDYSVKRKYLLKIKKALQCSSLKLCFVVPEDIYAQFPQQKYLNEDNKVCEYKMDWVTQWAVCVPIKTNV